MFLKDTRDKKEYFKNENSNKTISKTPTNLSSLRQMQIQTELWKRSKSRKLSLLAVRINVLTNFVTRWAQI